MIRGYDTLDFLRDGAKRARGAVAPVALRVLKGIIARFARGRPGVRLHGIAPLHPLLSPEGPVGALAAATLRSPCRAVRAILFDKTRDSNWSLPWHQDRTIAVQERVDIDGFGPWTTKSGLLHVAPPFGILAGMVTLRVHLDPVPPANGPLRIAPGSHRLGTIPEHAIERAVRQCGTAICLAEAGDIWIYSTPILHASEAATHPERRRVLQIDYAAGELPGGLKWLGI